MFKNIVSIILENKISKKTIEMIYNFIKLNNANVFFISLIDSKIIERICNETGRRRKKVEEGQIMKRYEELYEIEEFFKSKDIKIEIDTRLFTGFEEMSNTLNSLESDILIFCEPDEDELKDIIKIKTNVPILILRR